VIARLIRSVPLTGKSILAAMQAARIGPVPAGERIQSTADLFLI
jgi:hypothetical protein